MEPTQSLRSLNLYEILANLIPGSTLILIFVLVFRIENYILLDGGAFLLAVFIIIALVLGHVIQAFASELEGTPVLFGTVIQISRGQKEEDESPIPITHVERSFWPLMKRKFSLPEEFDNYGEMFRLLLSYVETTPATRALHFQAVHSFHRSMWAVWHLAVGLSLLGIGAKFLGFGAVRPWQVLVIAVLGSIFGIRIFGQRKEKFNKLFIQYAIVDFYSDQVGEHKQSNRPAR